MKFGKLFLAIALSGFMGRTAGAEENLETGLVLSKSETLKALETKGFSLPALLADSAQTGLLGNQELSQLPAFRPVLEVIRQEVQGFTAKNPTLGRFFDLRFLENPKARFILVGVINRMDRGYHSGDLCGETRFIYRLAYHTTDNGKSVFSRLPMTINMVFRSGTSRDEANCADLAAAWIKMSSESKSQDWLDQGPLSPSFFQYGNLERLEINLQVVRAGAGAAGNFGGHAEYLLKVFERTNGVFHEATLENQIDREALLKNPALRAEFKKWLLQPANIKSADTGTLIFPKKFLAKKALSLAPGGIARSANRPFFGVFDAKDFQGVDYANLETVKSPVGFLRRLNDSTCTGCHQTRAIGGFHFTGLDPLNKYPGNSVFIPGSPHFMGDLLRRRQVVESIAARIGKPDFSRGFSARPQERRSHALEGSGLMNGWGGHCSISKDASFNRWSCAPGLKCLPLLDVSDSAGMGICVGEVQQVGDPCEFGKVTNQGFGKDVYSRFPVKYDVRVENSMCSPQSQLPGTKTGGFLGGSVRKKSCEDGPGEKGLPAEANCGPLPAAAPGFNACIGTKNFDECLRDFAMGVGLRGCDQKNPCRDDYICAESFRPDRGVCVPPYFLFQFRVDGHPDGNL